MASEVSLVFSTFPNPETARGAARQMVSGGFAACANLFPGVESIYIWEGKLNEEPEVLVLFKVATARLEAFEGKLQALHPYQLPEIVTVEAGKVLPAYAQWVVAQSTPIEAQP